MRSSSQHTSHEQRITEQNRSSTRDFLQLIARHVTARLARKPADSPHSRSGRKQKQITEKGRSNRANDTAD